jgi:hypothetical protein
MSAAEQDYVLGVALTRLVPGGVLALADETRPQGAFARLGHALARLPVVAATYLLTQTATRPVQALAARVRAAGFEAVTEEHPWASFVLVHARRPMR